MPPHAGYFPQIQPSLSSPGYLPYIPMKSYGSLDITFNCAVHSGLPQHSGGPTTGTGNFFPLLNTAPIPLSHPPLSPAAVDSIATPAHPSHLPLQQTDSGVVLTDAGVSLAADYSGCPAPLRQSQMLWSPNKHPEGGFQPNTFRMPNGIIPQFNGLPQRPRDADNKGLFAYNILRDLLYRITVFSTQVSPLFGPLATR